MIKKHLALTTSETRHDWLEVFANEDILSQITIYLNSVDYTRLAGTCRDIRSVPNVQITTEHISAIKKAMNNSSTYCPTELIIKYRHFAKGDFKKDLNTYIQTYINTKLSTKVNVLFSKLSENPGSNEAEKNAHTAEIKGIITKNPILVFAIRTYGDWEGYTPLHWAVINGRTDMAACLIDRVGKVTDTCNQASTPLHLAAQEGHIEIAQTLITAGADVTATNEFGASPLMWASRNGHKEIVQALLTAGAKTLRIEEFNNMLNSKNNLGETPLQLAVQKRHTAIEALLLANGANVTATTNSVWSPLHRAVSYIHIATEELLRKVGGIE